MGVIDMVILCAGEGRLQASRYLVEGGAGDDGCHLIIMRRVGHEEVALLLFFGIL